MRATVLALALALAVLAGVPDAEPILLPFDTDRDGTISKAELTAALRHLDLDGDTKVSPREMAGPGSREFARFDLDGDGLLDTDELLATRKLLAAFPQPKVELPDPAGPLPPVPYPKGNPHSDEKAVLGKILFWDQQLSVDDTVACGSCHQPEAGGADARVGTHPGHDGKPGTPDDVLGSPGIAKPGETEVQVTRRVSPSFFTAHHAPKLFWDGRAGDKLVDPVSGTVVLESGAALESQSLFPLMDNAEMSRPGRTWEQLTAKLAQAQPLKRAKDLTPDIVKALAADPTYPKLFARAFGDDAITPPRIAMAIATYERTLVADQTPYDKWLKGGWMKPQWIDGFRVFRQSNCAVCHAPPLFTDNTFRNIGLRPPAEDMGHAEVTKRNEDRGLFKVPSLRNVGLRKNRLMHHGNMRGLGSALSHYRARRERSEDNLDPMLIRRIGPGPRRRAVVEFLKHALTDPRVEQALPPFDHPRIE
ncbi:MAG: cytochrome c peroxidase [Planctomycetota bacterium]|jgi:cytochrome c peroxidase